MSDDAEKPIFYHIEMGNYDIVKGMVEENKDLTHAATNSGMNPYQYAAFTGQRQILQYLQEKCTDLSFALHASCVRDQSEITKYLLDEGFNPLAQDTTSMTPLHIAVRYNSIRCINTLLDFARTNNISNIISMKDENSETPLDYANRVQNKAVISLLEEEEKRVKASKKLTQTNSANTMSSKALDAFKLEKVPSLLIQPIKGEIPSPPATDKQQNILYARFLKENNKHIHGKKQSDIKRLKFKDIPPNVRNPDGETFMHFAVREDNLLLMKKLKELDYDINAIDLKGNTPVHLACQLSNVRAIVYLQSIGAAMNLLNCDGLAPIHLLIQNKKFDIIRGVGVYFNLNICTGDGTTPFHLAIKVGSLKCLQALWFHEKKLEINFPDDSGNTPLKTAINHGYDDIIHFLQKLPGIEMEYPGPVIEW